MRGPHQQHAEVRRLLHADRHNNVWNARLLEGDAADAVAALKQQPGQDLLKFGTGSFTRTLLERGLIDEFHRWTFPVIAGTTDSSFDGLPVTHLQLLGTTTFASGIVVHVYGPRQG